MAISETLVDSGSVFTVHNPQTMTVTADSHDITFDPCDVANGNYFVASGKDILLVKNNGGGSAYYVTITAKTDSYARTGSISQYDVGIDEVAWFGILDLGGFGTVDGQTTYVALQGENVAIEFAVMRLP